MPTAFVISSGNDSIEQLFPFYKSCCIFDVDVAEQARVFLFAHHARHVGRDGDIGEVIRGSVRWKRFRRMNVEGRAGKLSAGQRNA